MGSDKGKASRRRVTRHTVGFVSELVTEVWPYELPPERPALESSGITADCDPAMGSSPIPSMTYEPPEGY